MGGPFGDELVEDGGEVAQLVQVGGTEAGQPCFAVRGEGDPGQPAVLGIPPPRDDAREGGPVDEFHHAVVAQQQVLGEVGDRWVLAAWVALIATSNWCCAGVRPTARAWVWLQCRNRRKPVRNASKFSKSAGDISGTSSP